MIKWVQVRHDGGKVMIRADLITKIQELYDPSPGAAVFFQDGGAERFYGPNAYADLQKGLL